VRRNVGGNIICRRMYTREKCLFCLFRLRNTTGMFRRHCSNDSRIGRGVVVVGWFIDSPIFRIRVSMDSLNRKSIFNHDFFSIT
jgi:hypothetical protein